MSETRPLVSVIIPVYNVEDYLRPCVDSVLAQTLENIEVIAVDDGSTDGSLAILREYAEKDARVTVLTQKNGSAGMARNTGLAVATGETLSFLDSDDFFELNMLEKAYNKLKETKAQFVAFDSDLYLNDEQKYKAAKHIDKDALPPWEPFHRRAMTNNPFRVFIGWAWDKLYDTDFVKSNQLTFQVQRTTNDMAFVFSAVVIAERIAWIDEKLAHHRKNVGSSLSNTRENSWHCYHDALIRVRDFVRDRGLWSELEQDFVNYALHATLWNLGSLAPATQEKLFNRLKEEWLEEFGLMNRPESYFDNPRDYQKLLQIQKMSYAQYTHQ